MECASLNVDWIVIISRVLRKLYKANQVSTLCKEIVLNPIFNPILPNGVYRIVEENTTKIYVLSYNGWSMYDEYENLVIKESDLDFLRGKLNKEIAEVLVGEILHQQAIQFEKMNYYSSNILNEQGDIVGATWSPERAVRTVIEDYFCEEVLDMQAKEITARLYDAKPGISSLYFL